MGLAEESRRATRSLLEDLYADYDSFSVLNETVSLPGDRYDARRAALERDGVGRVTVWVVDSQDLLLTRSTDGSRLWTVPSTPRRRDETPEAAAHRVVETTTNVECDLTGVYQVSQTAVDNRDDLDAPTLHDVTVHFDAVREAGRPAADDGVESAAFHASPPEPVEPAVESRLAGWLSAGALPDFDSST
jgi:ADP-ribose pyrophosphatase YjhB (NUDIX family)